MYSINSRVRYSEVNRKKQLTLPALLDYLQDCSAFQSEDLDVGLNYLEKNKIAWVLSWQIEIIRYPKISEEITVSTWPYSFKGFYGGRNFLITDKDGEVLAKANSLWVFMDVVKMRPARITEQIMETYKDKIEEQLSGEWNSRKISIPQDGEQKDPVHVAKFHIDTNQHVNNGKYVLIAEEFLPEDFEIGNLRVEYKKAAVLGDILYPTVTVEDNQAWVVLGDEAGTPYAIIQFFRK